MSHRTTHEVDGQTYEVVHQHRGDIIIDTDSGEKRLVDDFGEWVASQYTDHTSDTGLEPDDSACPICGEPYDSYLTHLKICSVIDV
ncbi:MAG: hypothetical protein A07HR60_02484 [uncultured archaeon A07HR60]|nr:MAG: hypothetical protein A07HR60_02484 [uncultured archaeon A07HR60]